MNKHDIDTVESDGGSEDDKIKTNINLHEELLSGDGDADSSVTSVDLDDITSSVIETGTGTDKPDKTQTKEKLTIKTVKKKTTTCRLLINGDEKKDGGMKRLLKHMHVRHKDYSVMNASASRLSASRARAFSVFIILIGVITGITTIFIHQFVDEEWSTPVAQAVILIMTALTAVKDTLNYSKMAEQYKNAKNNHLSVMALIEIALACDEENGNTKYDYSTVLEDIQAKHDLLKKSSAEIPYSIAKAYPQYG
jgi:hypothetical protein